MLALCVLMGIRDAVPLSTTLDPGFQTPMHVSSLYIYPIKACKGCEVPRAIVETTGDSQCFRCVVLLLQLDRRCLRLSLRSLLDDRNRSRGSFCNSAPGCQTGFDRNAASTRCLHSWKPRSPRPKGGVDTLCPRHA